MTDRHELGTEPAGCGARPDAEQIKAWDRSHVWHAFTPMATYHPFVIERAEGCELIDIDGRRYLDAESSLWCNVHGHRHPEIDRAIREQLDRVAHVTLLGMGSDITARLARRLVELAPRPLDHVFFASDGACAVEVAMKLAFQAARLQDPSTSRDRFLCLDSAYHGDTLGTLAVGGVDRFNRVFQPLLFEVVRGPLPDSYRLPDGIGAEEACRFRLQQVEALLEEHCERLVAVVLEPRIQCAAGIVVHPKGFLRGVAELCRRYGVRLIADEIAVGCGRTGTWTACESEGVVPDFLCLGKGLSGGYLPLAVTLVSAEIYQAFLGSPENPHVFCHGHTFGGNPLACAAALASLELMQRDRVLENVRERARQAKSGLESLREHPHVGDIRGVGLAMGIELVANRGSKTPFPAAKRIGARVCENATRRGVWLRPLGDVIVMMPPLVIAPEQIDRMVQTVRAAIHEELGC